MAINVQIQGSVATIVASDRFDFQAHREFKEAHAPVLANSAIRESRLI